MKKHLLDRRDFLKLCGLAGINLLLPTSQATQSPVSLEQASTQPNIIILLLDTLSARHMSLYGYPRQTTPNIDRLADISTVFHHHYAAGNFTIPSTASLLTGTYPWSHRALNILGSIAQQYQDASVFRNSDFSSVTYTHNVNVSYLLSQFTSDIDQAILVEELMLFDPISASRSTKILNDLVSNDYPMGYIGINKWLDDYVGMSNSLFLDKLEDLLRFPKQRKATAEYVSDFPLGLCESWVGNLFRLEDVIEWIPDKLATCQDSYLGYFHLLPPHEPYRPRADYYGHFENDSFYPITKPPNFFSKNVSDDELKAFRRLYDEFILYVDAEIGRLYDLLIAANILENSYLIITSDHGQLFERGIHGHLNPTLYEPLIHIPLIIHAPGQTQRQDVRTPTSIIDIMPTLLHLNRQEVPPWCEGQILPGLGDTDNPERSVFVVEAKENPKFAPIKKGTLSIIRWPYKLINYRGYSGHENTNELYDLENDPEELDDLAQSKPEITADLQQELDYNLSNAEQKSLGNS